MAAATSEYTIAPDGCFTAPLVLSYPYGRTLGATYGRFFTGLRDGRIEGTRGADGTVYVPPIEFDPVTGAACTECTVPPASASSSATSLRRERRRISSIVAV